MAQVLGFGVTRKLLQGQAKYYLGAQNGTCLVAEQKGN